MNPIHTLPFEVRAEFLARHPEMSESIPKLDYFRPICIYEGSITESCLSCTSGERHVRVCLHPNPSDENRDVCTRAYVSDKVQSCDRCQDRKTSKDHETLVARFDHENLARGTPGYRFNSSLIRWGKGFLLAWRNGWAGSDIYITQHDGMMRPVGPPIKLDLWHPESEYGREDPRLFLFRGQLHVAFIGVSDRGGFHTSQMYARLTDDLRVERVFELKYARRNSWEKNWQFFEDAGLLYAVYSIAPHRIIHIDGEYVTDAFETPNGHRWAGGERRGGAPPVQVGDEYWSFFHDRVEQNGHRIYRTGLYTFDVKPPFKVLRQTIRPIVTADRATKPHGQYASVVFPSGTALLAGGADKSQEDIIFTAGAVHSQLWWLVSHGIHDRWTEIHKWSHADLEARLQEK